MSRIKQAIKVDGRLCWTLFETGARNTYVTPQVAKALNVSVPTPTVRTALGGSVKETNRATVNSRSVEARFSSSPHLERVHFFSGRRIT
jgi:hypothetical protein